MNNAADIFGIVEKSIQLIGAGISVWGVIELIQSHMEQNPQVKMSGIKSTACGLILIFAAPPLMNWFQSYLPS